MAAVLTALLGRTSDYHRGTMEGAAALAEALGARWGIEPDRVGEVGDGHHAAWADDLRAAVPALLETGRRAGAALDAGRVPVVVSGHCPVAMGTLPEVARRLPECHVLWLDAHPDFHSPDTTTSQFLGGMCLAAPCGVWDAGLGAGVRGPHVIVADGRDVDPGERDLLRREGVRLLGAPGVADAVAGRDVFIHLDLDVLDPAFLPRLDFPVPDGWTPGLLGEVLRSAAERARVVGIEITDTTPEVAPMVAGVIDEAVGRLLGLGAS